MSDEIRKLGPGTIHYAPPPNLPASPLPSDLLRTLTERPIITPEQAEVLRKAFEDLGRSVRKSLEQLGPVVTRLREDLREAGVLPEVPPEDPKAKALWLRQHRNTGPERRGPQHRRRTDQ
jgi:hypothetical protein